MKAGMLQAELMSSDHWPVPDPHKNAPELSTQQEEAARALREAVQAQNSKLYCWMG